MKKCKEHTRTNQRKGKPCVQIIAEGNCRKQKCRLFPKVLRILPKLKKWRELEAKGLITTTVWDFSEKAINKRLKRKKKAEKWLNEFYPRIVKELQS